MATLGLINAVDRFEFGRTRGCAPDLVSSLLVKASQGAQTKQIIATTYEESVARRLDETDAARLVYVEAEPET